jgi:Streptomycin adenylyltransferase
MNPTEMLFNQIVKDAQKDPNILAFWLNGSRGKGVITPYSDYDCTMMSLATCPEPSGFTDSLQVRRSGNSVIGQ